MCQGRSIKGKKIRLFDVSWGVFPLADLPCFYGASRIPHSESRGAAEDERMMRETD
jgi:hypothetical protein